VDDGEGPPRKGIPKFIFVTLMKKVSANENNFLNPEIVKEWVSDSPEPEKADEPMGSLSPISNDSENNESMKDEYDPSAPIALKVVDPRLQMGGGVPELRAPMKTVPDQIFGGPPPPLR
jgi:hypothetical protein